MAFRIEQVESEHESFGNHRYRIFEDDRLIARYWHDFRGDEHGIEFVDGTSEPSPVGRVIDFVEGGGPKPLLLSERALDYLRRKQSQQ
jgi:hypothetical protein